MPVTRSPKKLPPDPERVQGGRRKKGERPVTIRHWRTIGAIRSRVVARTALAGRTQPGGTLPPAHAIGASRDALRASNGRHERWKIARKRRPPPFASGTASSQDFAACG